MDRKTPRSDVIIAGESAMTCRRMSDSSLLVWDFRRVLSCSVKWKWKWKVNESNVLIDLRMASASLRFQKCGTWSDNVCRISRPSDRRSKTFCLIRGWRLPPKEFPPSCDVASCCCCCRCFDGAREFHFKTRNRSSSRSYRWREFFPMLFISAKVYTMYTTHAAPPKQSNQSISVRRSLWSALPRSSWNFNSFGFVCS